MLIWIGKGSPLTRDESEEGTEGRRDHGSFDQVVVMTDGSLLITVGSEISERDASGNLLILEKEQDVRLIVAIITLPDSPTAEQIKLWSRKVNPH